MNQYVKSILSKYPFFVSDEANKIGIFFTKAVIAANIRYIGFVIVS